MCGRYANHVKAMRDWVRIFADWPADVELKYNITPSQTIPVVKSDGAVAARWGLIPHWSKGGSMKYATHNARIESASEKPVFRSPWKRGQTCLVPALGYYEWRAEGGRKQPYFIHSADGGPIVFAGLWELWRNDDQEILSCTILTRPAADGLSHLHPRMPVLLRPDQADLWLNSPHDVSDGIANNKPNDIEFYSVSMAVNNPRNEGEDLIRPI